MLTIQDYTLSHNRVNALKDSGQLRDYNKDVPMFALVFAATAALTALAIGWSVSLRRKVADLSAQLVDRQGKLRAFAVELIRAEEEQRTRIARELHDGLGQMMTAVNIELQVLKDAASDELRPRVDDVRALSAQVMGEMRRISQELRPAIHDEMGLAEAVRALVSRMARLGAVAIEVQVAGDVDVLPADAAIACYRMVQ
ncbi:MAG: sensor histidine kinase, partial [Polyangia bacterium]